LIQNGAAAATGEYARRNLQSVADIFEQPDSAYSTMTDLPMRAPGIAKQNDRFAFGWCSRLNLQHVVCSETFHLQKGEVGTGVSGDNRLNRKSLACKSLDANFIGVADDVKICDYAIWRDEKAATLQQGAAAIIISSNYYDRALQRSDFLIAELVCREG